MKLKAETSKNAETQELNIPVIMPNTFIREWKCAKTNPPTESDRYWCFVKEQNDLGISYYQWNCSYNVGIGFTKPHHNDIEITHWTELLPRPF